MIVGGLSNFLTFGSNCLMSECSDLQLKNTIFDDIRIDSGLLPFISEKKLWEYDTVVYGRFSNNLYAGNLDLLNGLTLKEIRVKKRKLDSMEWMNVAIVPFTDNMIYSFRDKLVESNQDYEYAIQSISYGDMVGSEMTREVECDFSGVWLMGNKDVYQIRYDDKISDITNTVSENIITTLGSKYPFIIRNGNINYKTFDVSGTILSDSTEHMDSKQSEKEDKKLREKLLQFLINGKPKIVKDSSGNYILSQIYDVKLKPIDDLYRRLYEVTFNVVEIGDAYDEETLVSYGLFETEVIS